MAVGYQKAGAAGAIVASVAVVLSSLLIVLTAGKLLLRFRDHQLLKSAFHGLRPAVTGMVAYTAFVFAQHSGMFGKLTWFGWSQILIFTGSLCALVFLRKHPFFVILLSGLVESLCTDNRRLRRPLR